MNHKHTFKRIILKKSNEPQTTRKYGQENTVNYQKMIYLKNRHKGKLKTYTKAWKYWM